MDAQGAVTRCPNCGNDEFRLHLLFDVEPDDDLYHELATCTKCEFTVDADTLNKEAVKCSQVE